MRFYPSVAAVSMRPLTRHPSPSSVWAPRAIFVQTRLSHSSNNNSRPTEGWSGNATSSSSAFSQSPYNFPTGRALRYVRLGRRFHQRDTEGVTRVRQVLREASEAAWGGTKNHKHEKSDESAVLFSLDDDSDAYRCASLGPSSAAKALLQLGDDSSENDHSATLTSSDDLRDEVEEGFCAADDAARTLAAAAKFTKYHCHHVTVNFKRRRQQWTAASKRHFSEARGRNHNGDKTRSAAPSRGAPLGSMPEVFSYIFAASVLLHITGLFGVGDRYIENLLQVLVSASALVSQTCNHTRHHHRRGAGELNKRGRGGGNSGKGSNANKWKENTTRENDRGAIGAAGATLAGHNIFFTDPRIPPQAWRSLHWATHHFTQGALYWELLHHRPESELGEEMLLFSPSARVLFHRLLQANAALVLELVELSPVAPPRSGAPGSSCGVLQLVRRDDWDSLHLLKGCTKTQQRSGAIATWFGERDGSDSTETAQADFGTNAKRKEMSRQSKPPHPTKDTVVSLQRRLQTLPLFWTVLLCHRVHSAESSFASCARADDTTDLVSYATVRHDLLCLLRLFPAEAKADALVAGLLQFVYGRSFAQLEFPQLVAVLSTTNKHHADPFSHVEAALLMSVLEEAQSFGRRRTPQVLETITNAAAAAATGATGAIAGASVDGVKKKKWKGATNQYPLIMGRNLHRQLVRIHDDSVSLYHAILSIPLCLTNAPAAEERTTRRRPYTAAESLQVYRLRWLHRLLWRVQLQWRLPRAATARVNEGRSDDDATLVTQQDSTIPEDTDTARREEEKQEHRRLRLRADVLRELSTLLQALKHLRRLQERLVPIVSSDEKEGNHSVGGSGHVNASHRCSDKGHVVAVAWAEAAVAAVQSLLRCLAVQLAESTLPLLCQELIEQHRLREHTRVNLLNSGPATTSVDADTHHFLLLTCQLVGAMDALVRQNTSRRQAVHSDASFLVMQRNASAAEVEMQLRRFCKGLVQLSDDGAAKNNNDEQFKNEADPTGCGGDDNETVSSDAQGLGLLPPQYTVALQEWSRVVLELLK